MPTKVPIEIFLIARTQVNYESTKEWLRFLGVSNEGIAKTIDDEKLTDPSLAVAVSGKRCYKSFEPKLNPNVSRVREDYAEYFDNILKSGHGSVLEHASFTFAIENVSRVFTGEMNRHRAGWAISEASMRFIRFGENIPYWEPTCVQGPDCLEDSTIKEIKEVHHSIVAHRVKEGLLKLGTLEAKRHATRLAIEEAFCEQQDTYRLIESIWADELAEGSKFSGKKEITSMMRRIVGMGCATGGVWTGNARALRHVITMRAAPEAEEEILHVFTRIAKLMRDEEPLLFGDFELVDGYWRPKYKKV